MVQDIAHGLGICSGVERNGGVTCHPDGQFRHEEVGAVLTDNPNFTFGLQIHCPDMGGHTPSLANGLFPRVILYEATTDGLGHPNFSRPTLFVGVDIV